jgi:hypothetical protein
VVLFFETRRLKVSDVWPWFRFSSVLSLLPPGMKERLCGGGRRWVMGGSQSEEGGETKSRGGLRG